MRSICPEVFARSVAAAGLLLAPVLGGPVAGCATVSGRSTLSAEAAPGETGRSEAQVVEQWGVELRGVRLAAAGYLLDFRYRVIEPQKAVPIFRRQNKPVLIDEESGARFFVPRPPTTGPMRNTYTPQVGRTYFMLFGNPGRYVKQGSKVTVEIGDFRAAHLVVQ